MDKPITVDVINVDFQDEGVWLTLHYTDGQTIRVWINNKWLVTLAGAFRDRLDYLAEAGIFRPEP